MAALLLASSGAVKIQAAGASFPNRLYKDASFEYSFVNGQATVSYASLGSGKGKCRIQDYATECSPSDVAEPFVVSWAGSDSVLTDHDYSKYPDLQMYPTVAGAVVPIYNLPESTPGYSTLTLSTVLLAQIFRGAVTTWGHPLLVESNPWLVNLPLPNATILVVVRQDSSGSTEMFKKALSSIDPAFATQIGKSSEGEWPGVAVTKRETNFGVVARVKSTVYSIGYSVLAEAIEMGSPRAVLIKQGGGVVEASVSAVQFAVAELGLSFGNNGDAPSRLTADVHNALGPLAWPIAGYTYMVLRKNTTRFDLGETCEERRQTLRFFEWFYSSNLVLKLANAHGFATLPVVVRDIILERLRDHMHCNGSAVYERPIHRSLVFRGSELLSAVVRLMSTWYASIDDSYSIEFKAGPSDGALLLSLLSTASLSPAAPALDGPAVALLSQPARAALTDDFIQIPFAGAPVAIIYSFCLSTADASCFGSGEQLSLDLSTLAALVDGQISSWADERIAALNPWMASSSVAAVLAATPMVLYGEAPDAELMQMLRASLATAAPSLSFAAFDRRNTSVGRVQASSIQVQAAVADHPFSIGIVHMDGSIDSRLLVAAIGRNRTANFLLPASDTVLACAQDLTAELSESSHPDCYPLSSTIMLFARKTYSQQECAGSRPLPLLLAKLLFWMLASPAASPLASMIRTQNLAPLFDLLPRNTLAASLEELSCNSTSMLLAYQNKNFIPEWAQLMAFVSFGSSMVLSVAVALWVVAKRSHGVVKAAQPFFLLLTTCGTLITLFGAIVMAFDHQGLQPQPGSTLGKEGVYPILDLSCNVQVVCYTMGFVVTMSGLLAKQWRATMLSKSANRMEKLQITSADMVKKLLLFAPVEIVLLVGMISNDWSRFFYKVIILQTDEEGFATESTGRCTAEEPLAFICTILAIHLAVLVFGNYLCYISRRVDSAFSEGKYLAFALANTLQTHLFAVLLGAFLYEEVVPFYIIRWLALMCYAVGLLGVIIIPKVIAVHFPSMTTQYIFGDDTNTPQIRIAPHPTRSSPRVRRPDPRSSQGATGRSTQ